MSPAVKYTLGRAGVFIACAVPVVLLTPKNMSVLVKLLIALVASAVLSYYLLRGWRDEVAQQMAANARRRLEEQRRLREALAGDEPPAEPPADDKDPS